MASLPFLRHCWAEVAFQARCTSALLGHCTWAVRCNCCLVEGLHLPEGGSLSSFVGVAAVDAEDIARGQGAEEHVFVAALGHQEHLAGEHLFHLTASCQAVAAAVVAVAAAADAVVAEGELVNCSIRPNTVGHQDNRGSQVEYYWVAHMGLEGSLQGEARTWVGVRNVHNWDPAVPRTEASVVGWGGEEVALGLEVHWELRRRLPPPSWDCTSCERAGPWEAAGIHPGQSAPPFCPVSVRSRGCSAASAVVVLRLRAVVVVQASVPQPGTSNRKTGWPSGGCRSRPWAESC